MKYFRDDSTPGRNAIFFDWIFGIEKNDSTFYISDGDGYEVSFSKKHMIGLLKETIDWVEAQ